MKTSPQTLPHKRSCANANMSKISPMPPATASPAPRRSQAERSATTRDALLDATIACLVEDGYANTTTSRVAERAGVSRGAHLHHFQTRQALLAAAMERLAERRGAELLAAAEDLPEGRERLVQGLDLLWASYANPLFQAALDLWSHARTDPDLRERLVPVERRLDRQTLAITRQPVPGARRAARLRPADRDGRVDDPWARPARHAAPGRWAQSQAVELQPCAAGRAVRGGTVTALLRRVDRRRSPI